MSVNRVQRHNLSCRWTRNGKSGRGTSARIFAAATTKQIVLQVQRARERDPDTVLDLVAMDLENTAVLFKKKA